MGCRVSVAVAPKTADSQRGLTVEGTDYGLLGENADQVFLKTYEWGYIYGPPMAVAPLDKVRQVVEYAVTKIPAEKLILGIPNYGYDWALPYERGITRAGRVGIREAEETAAENGAVVRYAEIAQSPWFTYLTGGAEHIVWFEDARSIAAKWNLAREFGLSGVRYWNLMQEFRRGSICPGRADRTLPVSDKIVSGSQGIRKEPADGNGPPDSDDTECGNRRECIRQSDPGAERDNGQNDGHSRIADGTIEAVEQEQEPDEGVK